MYRTIIPQRVLLLFPKVTQLHFWVLHPKDACVLRRLSEGSADGSFELNHGIHLVQFKGQKKEWRSPLRPRLSAAKYEDTYLEKNSLYFLRL